MSCIGQKLSSIATITFVAVVISPHELDYENLAAAYWRPGKTRWRPYLHSLNIEARLADLRKEVGALPREPCVR
jgi:hypothetical protein